MEPSDDSYYRIIRSESQVQHYSKKPLTTPRMPKFCQRDTRRLRTHGALNSERASPRSVATPKTWAYNVLISKRVSTLISTGRFTILTSVVLLQGSLRGKQPECRLHEEHDVKHHRSHRCIPSLELSRYNGNIDGLDVGSTEGIRICSRPCLRFPQLEKYSRQ